MAQSRCRNSAPAWTTEDDRREIGVDEVMDFVMAARLSMDEDNDDYIPRAEDPIALMLCPSERRDPRFDMFGAVWRDLVGHGSLEMLRKRLCAVCGMSRPEAVAIINYMEAIAESIAQETALSDRLQHATRHVHERGMLLALQQTVTSVAWTAETEEAVASLLVLLPK
jgi:hypothetical protein